MCVIAVTLALELLLMNGIGIFIRRSGAADENFVSRLTNLIMTFCIPCLIFRSISNAVEFSLDALANCAMVMLLAAGAVVLSLGVGQVFFLLNHKNGAGRVLRYGLTFCNFSFMGIPVMEALFGELGTFYYAFFLIPVRIAYYALSERLMTPRGEAGTQKSPGRMVRDVVLNPCLVAVALGLVFWVGGWQLPTAVNNCIRSMSSISSPLALLMCGMVVAGYDLKRLLRARYLILPLMRTLLMPALFYGVSRLLLLAGVEELLCRLVVVFAALPVASLLPVFEVKYDPEPENQINAAAASMISTLLSAVTIPIWYTLL